MAWRCNGVKINRKTTYMKKSILLLSLLMVAGTASASSVKFDEHTFSRNPDQNEHSVKKKNKQHRPDFSVLNVRGKNPFNTADNIWKDGFNRFDINHEEHVTDVLNAHQPDFSNLFHEFTARDHHNGGHFDDDKHDFVSVLHDREHDYIGGGFNPQQCGTPPDPVPVPAAAWLFLSGLAGLLRLAHRHKK